MSGYDRVLGSDSRRNGGKTEEEIILERELIGTINADETELRLSRFQWRWKALEKLRYEDF